MILHEKYEKGLGISLSMKKWHFMKSMIKVGVLVQVG